jgi:hypothetical protein
VPKASLNLAVQKHYRLLARAAMATSAATGAVRIVTRACGIVGTVLASRIQTVVSRSLRRSVMHAVVRIGDSALMVGDPTGPAAEFGPMPSSIYLYVDDCDSVYRRAI